MRLSKKIALAEKEVEQAKKELIALLEGQIIVKSRRNVQGYAARRKLANRKRLREIL